MPSMPPGETKVHGVAPAGEVARVGQRHADPGHDLLDAGAGLGRPVERGAAGVVAVHEPLLRPTPRRVGSVTPSFLASASISHGSQTLRKSMNSGGLPPVSQVKKSIVSRPCTSASVAKGSGGLRPLWSNVELKSDSITSATGSGMPRRSQPHSSWLMNPPPTAFRSASRSRTIRYIARLWSNRSVSACVAQLQPLADVLVDPAAQRLQLLRVVGLLVEHVGQQLHVQPGDLEAELLAGRDDVRQGGLHAHRVVAEDDDAPALERLRGHGRVAPVDQRLGGALGHLRVQAGVGPGADVEVRRAGRTARARR